MPTGPTRRRGKLPIRILAFRFRYDYMARECQRAKESPSYENTFKRLHLNIKTEQDIRWLQMDRWDASDGAIDEGQLTGKPCWCGLDLSTTTDLSAFAMVFPDDMAATTCFAVSGFRQRTRSSGRRRDRVPYSIWIREGWITATDGRRDRLRRDPRGHRRIGQTL